MAVWSETRDPGAVKEEHHSARLRQMRSRAGSERSEKPKCWRSDLGMKWVHPGSFCNSEKQRTYGIRNLEEYTEDWRSGTGLQVFLSLAGPACTPTLLLFWCLAPGHALHCVPRDPLQRDG